MTCSRSQSKYNGKPGFDLVNPAPKAVLDYTMLAFNDFQFQTLHFINENAAVKVETGLA